MNPQTSTAVNPEVITTINAILQERFEVPAEKLVPTAQIKGDLRLDSLDFVDMFILLEEKTGKTAQNVDFMKIQTLGDVYLMVDELAKQPN